MTATKADPDAVRADEAAATMLSPSCGQDSAQAFAAVLWACAMADQPA